MAKNNIELNIGSRFDASGFKNLNRNLQSASGNVKKASQAMGQVIGAIGDLGVSAGNATKAVGGLIGDLMQFGVWGAVLAAVGAVVNKFREWREAVEDQRKAHREMIASTLRDVEFYDARAQRSLDARMAREAAAAAERKRLQDKEMAEFTERSKKAQQAWNDREARARDIAIMQMELDQEGGDGVQGAKNAAALAKARAESRLAGAQANRRAALRFYGADSREEVAAAQEVAKAELELALVIKRNKEAIEAAMKSEKEAAERVADEKAKEAERIAKSEKEAADRAAKAKAREEADKRIAELRQGNDKAVADLDKKIAAARERAARLEEDASRARGKSFTEWSRGEKQIARQKRRDENRQERRMRSALAQIDVLEAERRRNGRGFSPQRAAALARLREWVADQDPKNNPALKLAEKLEKDKMDLISKTQRDIADIAQKLKDATTL